VWSTVYAFDTTKLNPQPTTMADFFDVRKFPGKRGVRKSPKGLLEWALIADGVSPKDVYKVLGTPAGLDRAFKKADSIKSSIVWWDAGAQPPQLLADGAVVMTMAYNGRIYDAEHNGHKPFKIVWDGQIYDFEYWGIPTGTKHQAAAEKFVTFATAPDRIGDLSNYIPYAPPRKSAISKISATILPNMPTAPANFADALQIDASFWADNIDMITKRFEAWISG
jgi:putative spermidine/putrescine transport system substrate-binding protein